MNHKGYFDSGDRFIKIRQNLFVYLCSVSTIVNKAKAVRVYFVDGSFTILGVPQNFHILEKTGESLDAPSVVFPEPENFYNLYTDSNYSFVLDGTPILCLESESKWVISGIDVN